MVDIWYDVPERGRGATAGGGRREAGAVLGMQYSLRRIGGGGPGEVSFSRAYSRYYTPFASVICALVR
jgi:hypothetical protein